MSVSRAIIERLAGLSLAPSWRDRSSTGACRSRGTRARFRLEGLEDRCLLSITEFPLPAGHAEPSGITAGPDGNLWFVENGYNGYIGMINPTTHAISEFATPTASSAPHCITAGPDGNLWFTEYNTATRSG